MTGSLVSPMVSWPYRVQFLGECVSSRAQAPHLCGMTFTSPAFSFIKKKEKKRAGGLRVRV